MGNNNELHRVYIAWGSNDHPARRIPEGLKALAQQVTVVAVSSVYHGEASGTMPAPPYWNGVACIQTVWDAVTLKEALRAMETAHGRIRRTPDGQKSPIVALDFDILLFDGAIPHTDWLKHDFVALPLAEIEPTLIHPVTGESAQTIAERFRPTSQLIRTEFNRSWLA